MRNFLFKKRLAVITGGSGDIGSASALKLADAGWNIALQYKEHREAAEKVKLKIQAKGCECEIFEADLSKPDDRRRLFSETEKLKESTGPALLLLNAAGVDIQEVFSSVKEEEASRLLSLNLEAVMDLSAIYLKPMIEEKWGRIINISSIWGISGASCEVHYSTSKAALIGFTKALAKETGPSGVTVNCICPGLIEGHMNAHLSEDTIKELIDATPVSRIGRADDIANAAAFFASPDSSFVTGQFLVVDGGLI